MRGSERELGQRGVFLVLRELGLKLAFFLVELAILGEPQEQFLQRRITLLLPLLNRRLELFEFLAKALALVMLRPAKSKKQSQRYDQKRKDVKGKQGLSPPFRIRWRNGSGRVDVRKWWSIWARNERAAPA